MTSLHTITRNQREAAATLCAGVQVCGQVFGMKPTAAHAINPRDPGGRSL